MSFMNARGQYGSRPIGAEYRQYGTRESERGQYGPIKADARNATAGCAMRMIAHLALHVAGILLVGLSLAYLLIRWSGA